MCAEMPWSHAEQGYTDMVSLFIADFRTAAHGAVVCDDTGVRAVYNVAKASYICLPAGPSADAIPRRKHETLRCYC